VGFAARWVDSAHGGCCVELEHPPTPTCGGQRACNLPAPWVGGARPDSVGCADGTRARRPCCLGSAVAPAAAAASSRQAVKKKSHGMAYIYFYPARSQTAPFHSRATAAACTVKSVATAAGQTSVMQQLLLVSTSKVGLKLDYRVTKGTHYRRLSKLACMHACMHAHCTTACSVGWWLMAGAGLF
jgi:hypothetical protein